MAKNFFKRADSASDQIRAQRMLSAYGECASMHARTSDEYRQNVQQIQDCVSSVHNRVVSFDLESTLVSGNFQATMDVPFFGFHDRVARPYAYEIMQALAGNGNKLLLWTHVNESDIKPIIQTSRLQVPAKTEIITKEKYLDALRKSSVAKKLAPYLDGNQPWTDYEIRRHRVIDSILTGRSKLPPVVGVDFHVDDHASKDQGPCAFVFGLESENTLVPVPDFRIWTIQALITSAFRDTGFVHVARELSRRAL